MPAMTDLTSCPLTLDLSKTESAYLKATFKNLTLTTNVDPTYWCKMYGSFEEASALNQSILSLATWVELYIFQAKFQSSGVPYFIPAE